MRVAIMGSGGLGGLLGARLAASGVDVMFIARGAHLRAMQTAGLRILSEQGDVHIPEVEATADPGGKPPVDFVVFTVKGPDTRAAANLIAPLVAAQTGIISFQNGVEGIEILADKYSAEAVLPGTTMTPAVIVEPGVIRHIGSNCQFNIGEWHGQISDRAKRFRDAADAAGVTVTISDQIHIDLWSKFVGMTTMSALTCLTRLPARTIVSVPETRQLVVHSMDEVIAVARARGIELPDDIKAGLLAFLDNLDPTWKTSMCNDLEAGKPIEVESLSGTMHRLGEELGVPTPIHTTAYRALKPFVNANP